MRLLLRPKFSRPIPRLFFETQIFETNTEIFLRPKLWRLIPRLFSRPNIFDTDTETFFETKIFRDRYSDIFRDQICRDRYWYSLKNEKKVSIPRSLETRCHTLCCSGCSPMFFWWFGFWYWTKKTDNPKVSLFKVLLLSTVPVDNHPCACTYTVRTVVSRDTTSQSGVAGDLNFQVEARQLDQGLVVPFSSKQHWIFSSTDISIFIKDKAWNVTNPFLWQLKGGGVGTDTGSLTW